MTAAEIDPTNCCKDSILAHVTMASPSVVMMIGVGLKRPYLDQPIPWLPDCEMFSLSYNISTVANCAMMLQSTPILLTGECKTNTWDVHGF